MSDDPSIPWAQDQARQVHLWHMAEQQRMLRAATAKGFGFDPLLFDRPFPGSAPNQVTIVNQDAPPPGMQPTTTATAPAVQAGAAPAAPTLLQRAAPWILGAVGMLGGGGVMGLLGYALHSTTAAPPAAVAPPAPTPAPVPSQPQSWDLHWKVGPQGLVPVGPAVPVPPGS